MLTAIRRLIVRDLTSVTDQVEAYPDDGSLWADAPGIANTGGTLALHIAGNLHHFIGTVLGSATYVRNRDAEFNARGASRAEIVKALKAAQHDVATSLENLPEDALAEDFPEQIGGAALSTEQALLHFAAHLTYHLGQIDYHRRFVTGGAPVKGMLSAKALE